MNKKRITLIFEGLQEVHLHKDVGMIPYILARDFEYESNILYFKDKNNAKLNSGFNKVKLVPFTKLFSFLPERFGFQFLKKIALIWYLAVYAKEIDVLMLFHPSYDRYFYTRLYKLVNPRGIVYLKLDMGKPALDTLQLLADQNKMKASYFFRKNIELTDLISIETNDMYEKLSECFVGIDIDNKLIHIPNGFDDMDEIAPSFENKENIILTVGRIGTYSKNTEMFLRVVKSLRLGNWRVYLIGPVESAFEKTLAEFYSNTPQLKDKFFVVGNITNKKELYAWYKKSKVFCLTSRSEGFPLVFPEALFFGNYIVSTDVGAATDVTDNQRLGKVCGIDDETEMAKALQHIIDGEIYLKSYHEEIVEFANNKYVWNKIVNKLFQELEILHEAKYSS